MNDYVHIFVVLLEIVALCIPIGICVCIVTALGFVAMTILINIRDARRKRKYGSIESPAHGVTFGDEELASNPYHHGGSGYFGDGVPGRPSNR